MTDPPCESATTPPVFRARLRLRPDRIVRLAADVEDASAEGRQGDGRQNGGGKGAFEGVASIRTVYFPLAVTGRHSKAGASLA